MSFSNIGLQEPSTITKSVASVTLTRNSSVEHQEILVIGDVSDTLAVARVLNSAPVSTEYGLAVRIVSGPSTAAVNVNITGDQVGSQTAADDSSVVGGSTAVAQTIATLYGWDGVGFTKWRRVEASTSAPAVGASGLNTRPCFAALDSTSVFISSSNSTAIASLVSSAAGLRVKVYGYAFMSTSVTPSTLHFWSSLVNGPKFSIGFGSGSSGMTGANMAVTPPAFLFQTAASEALNYTIESASTNQGGRLSFSFFKEA